MSGVVWVNFIREWQDLQFNVDFELQIFEKLFHGMCTYSQSFFFQKSAESPKKYFSYFIFDNELTHYILDHGDFIRNK